MSDYGNMTVAQLKELLKELGLASSGKKADLIARLEAANEEVQEEVDEEVDEEATTFSKPQSAKNDASGDNTASPKFPKKESFGTDEKSLFGSDGSEGKKGGDTPKSNPASDNLGEKPKAAPAPKVSSEKSQSPIAGKVK